MSPKRPVTVRGVTYESEAACAKAFGVGQGHVAYLLRMGTIDNLGLGRNSTNMKQVWVEGVPFASQADAARHIGMEPIPLNKKIRLRRKQGFTNLIIWGVEISWEKEK